MAVENVLTMCPHTVLHGWIPWWRSATNRPTTVVRDLQLWKPWVALDNGPAEEQSPLPSRRMRMVRFAVEAAVLLAVLPVMAEEPFRWGQAGNGLRMSIALAQADPRPGPEIGITFENLSGKDLLLPLGVKVGKAHPTFLEVHVETPGGAPRRVLYTALGHIAGYAEPLTIGLLKGERYTVRVSVGSYYVLDGSEKLALFLSRRCRLWVELAVTEAHCPRQSTLDPLRRSLPCWQGRLVSNILQLPGPK